MEKTIEVTIRLDKRGNADFEFYESESGDFYRICTTLNNCGEEESRVGSELLSWLDLMADEMLTEEEED